MRAVVFKLAWNGIEMNSFENKVVSTEVPLPVVYSTKLGYFWVGHKWKNGLRGHKGGFRLGYIRLG